MAEPMRREEAAVVDMVDYMRETLKKWDKAIAEFQASRQVMAIRLAAIEAASNARVEAAAAEFEAREKDGRAYEDAEDAGTLLSEAHSRYVQ